MVKYALANSAKRVLSNTQFDFRGLDLVSPYDLIQNGRTPHAKNFRLYSDNIEGRQIAVSTRKGQGEYLGPFFEAANISNVIATDGNATIGTILNWRVMPFTVTAGGRLTKVELNLRLGTGKGALLIDIYSDNAGVPGVKLADSSIAQTDILAAYSYVPCRFIEAPLLTINTKYWILAHVQEDGADGYEWASNTTTELSMVSNANVSGMEATLFSTNYKTYLSPDYTEKGFTRYTMINGTNHTVAAYGTSIYAFNDTTGVATAIVTGLSSSATQYHFFQCDGKLMWVNGYDSLKSWNGIVGAGSVIETITDTELPVLSMAVMHKNRIFGVVASEPNKIVFSEEPGNPSDAVYNKITDVEITPNTIASTAQWYYAWLSTNFMYAPTPKYSDPIASIRSFQDLLQIYLTMDKYSLYGSKKSEMTLRQATGTKGTLSQNTTFVDEEFIYSVARDGIYRFNGSSDERISDYILPIFKQIAHPEHITIAKWNQQIRFYYGEGSSAVNDSCLLFHTSLIEWQNDTDVHVKSAVYCSDNEDNGKLIESSSYVPAFYYAEQGYNSLGKAIDFEYFLKYESMGAPAQRKRFLKYFPLIQGVGQPFEISIDMDKDFSDAPTLNKVILTASGAIWSEFEWSDGTAWGSTASYKPQKLRYPGYAYYWQMRMSHRAVDNPVMFFGVQYSYKAKRL